nr:MAG TPA_asm: hypothetical protein [Caudoviricetes sp.]
MRYIIVALVQTLRFNTFSTKTKNPDFDFPKSKIRKSKIRKFPNATSHFTQ